MTQEGVSPHVNTGVYPERANMWDEIDLLLDLILSWLPVHER